MFYQTSMGLIYLIFNQLPFLWDTSGIEYLHITQVIEAESFRWKEVNESLKHVAPRVIIVKVGYILRRCLTFEERTTQLIASGSVLKSYGIAALPS